MLIRIFCLILPIMTLQAGAQTCPRTPSADATHIYIYLPATVTACCTAAAEVDYPNCAVTGTFPTTLNGVEACNDSVFAVPAIVPIDFSALGLGAATQSELEVALRSAVNFALCELDVSVEVTNTPPIPTEEKWTIVALGSDTYTHQRHGQAQAPQALDAPQRKKEYARIWTQRIDSWSGSALDGINATVDRWAKTLANFISHEVAHGFNATHASACPLLEVPLSSCFGDPTIAGCRCLLGPSGLGGDPATTFCDEATDEDSADSHLMAQPTITGDCATPGNSATELKHMSDTTVGTLGASTGLGVKTLGNWDFVNQNSDAADAMVLTLLVPDVTVDELNMSWFYTTVRAPWKKAGCPTSACTVTIGRIVGPVTDPADPLLNATIGDASGTHTIDGVVYSVFELIMDEKNNTGPNAWPPGPGGGWVEKDIVFHTGAAFVEAGVLVYGARLQKNVAGTMENLPLQPRMAGFGIGEIPAVSSGSGGAGGGFGAPGRAGIWGIDVFNFAAEAIILRNLQIRLLPRMMQLEDMVANVQAPRDQFGREVNILPRKTRAGSIETDLVVAPGRATIPIASLADSRYIDTFSWDCPASTPALCEGPEALSLFPATYVYLSGTIEDPNAPPGSEPVRFFRQMAGFIPDLNGNGIDDGFDVRRGTSLDDNNDGVPDEAQAGEFASQRRVFARLGVSDASNFGTGVSATLGVEQLIAASQRSWTVRLGYHQLDAPLGNDPDIWHVSLSQRLYLSMNNRLMPWVNVGVGIYDDPSGTQAGANVGLGVRWQGPARWSGEAALNRHQVAGSAIDFTALQVGMSYRWR